MTDLVVWRPSDGTWYFKSGKQVQWGKSGDVPVPADYNGDGEPEIAVWRPADGNWYIHPNPAPIQWGLPGDVPVPGDYTGDGRADLAVWRPSDGKWYVRNGAAVQWGLAGDVPVSVPAPVEGYTQAELDAAVNKAKQEASVAAATDVATAAVEEAKKYVP